MKVSLYRKESNKNREELLVSINITIKKTIISSYFAKGEKGSHIAWL